MSRLFESTWVTHDEEFDAEAKMGEQLTNALKGLGLDVYNEQYVVRVTVDKIDPPPPEPEEEENR